MPSSKLSDKHRLTDFSTEWTLRKTDVASTHISPPPHAPPTQTAERVLLSPLQPVPHSPQRPRQCSSEDPPHRVRGWDPRKNDAQATRTDSAPCPIFPCAPRRPHRSSTRGLPPPPRLHQPLVGTFCSTKRSTSLTWRPAPYPMAHLHKRATYYRVPFYMPLTVARAGKTLRPTVPLATLTVPVKTVAAPRQTTLRPTAATTMRPCTRSGIQMSVRTPPRPQRRSSRESSAPHARRGTPFICSTSARDPWRTRVRCILAPTVASFPCIFADCTLQWDGVDESFGMMAFITELLSAAQTNSSYQLHIQCLTIQFPTTCSTLADAGFTCRTGRFANKPPLSPADLPSSGRTSVVVAVFDRMCTMRRTGIICPHEIQCVIQQRYEYARCMGKCVAISNPTYVRVLGCQSAPRHRHQHALASRATTCCAL
eukprot:m.1347467 g.1347467  ORF g.1347467 m.1347467 type:complete len:426 (-) comp24912_c0_seq7:3251-4528(-)